MKLCSPTVFLALLLVSSPALADDPSPPPPAATEAAPTPLREALTGDAKAAYEEAMVLYENKDYAGAALRFRAAFDASHDLRLAYNVADCEIYQHHYAHAVSLLRRYVADGGPVLTDQRRQEVTDLIERIARFTTRVKIIVNVPGAEIFVDDQAVGQSPLGAPLVVDIGTHRIRASKAGFGASTRSVPLGESNEETVTLELEAETRAAPARPATRLIVHAPDDALISVDGEIVGHGVYSEDVAPGHHAIRVVQPWMAPLEADVSIADGETRAVDLDPGWRGVLGGMEFSLRGAGGALVRVPGQTPATEVAWLGVGVRLARAVYIGPYFQGGVADNGGYCGNDLSGLGTSASAQFTSCTILKVGGEVHVHLLPSGYVDPWIGVDFGALFYVERGEYAAAGAAVHAGVYSQSDVRTSFLTTKTLSQLGGQLGVDVHPMPSYWGFSVGPFAAVATTVAGSYVSVDSTTSPATLNVDGQTGSLQDLWWQVGLRTSVVF